MKTRVISGLSFGLLGIAIVVLTFSPLPDVMVYAISLMSVYELMKVFGVVNKLMYVFGIGFSALEITYMAYSEQLGISVNPVLALMIYFVAMLMLTLIDFGKTTFNHVALTAFSSMIIPGALGCFLKMRNMVGEYGDVLTRGHIRFLIWFCLAGAVFSDTFALFAGVKVRIHTRHSTFAPRPILTRFPMRNICGLINNTLSTQMISVSESTKDNLTAMGANPKKIAVVINGAEPLRKVSDEEARTLRASLGIKEDDFVVGMSARLEEVKGHIYLVEAARIIHERGVKNLKVLIIGTGTTEEMLKAKAAEYGISDSIIFPGFVSDVAPYIQIMDVIANCSFGTEATSMALIEAMSLAKPAVATDYGGNSFIIENVKNGYIVPQKSASNLAEAIQKLMDNPEKRLEMAKFAYSKYICRLTGKIMTGKVEKIYEEGYKQRCQK